MFSCCNPSVIGLDAPDVLERLAQIGGVDFGVPSPKKLLQNRDSCIAFELPLFCHAKTAKVVKTKGFLLRIYLVYHSS